MANTINNKTTRNMSNGNLESSPYRSDSPIVTFYSYKGGVGRSMALANIAILLAREHDLNVIAVDWDLEAPGLHHFFNIPESGIHDGVIHHFCRYKELLFNTDLEIKLEDLSIENALIEVPDTNGKVRLLAAGGLQDRFNYDKCVNDFNWNEFYRQWNGAQFVEYTRNQLKANADIVLIDSRTGNTDIGGICTMQMPDMVVLVFAFNNQNINGTETAARRLTSDDPVFESLGRRPEILFLPSRKELGELQLLRDWERKAAKRLEPYATSKRIQIRFPGALPYFQELSLPYVPYFAYGEELATDSNIGFELLGPLRVLAEMLTIQPEESKALELRSQAAAAQAAGEYPKALDAFEQALDISINIEDWKAAGDITLNMGNLYSTLGQIDRAIELYQVALDYLQFTGDQQGQATVYVNLGNAYRAQANLEQAIENFQAALAIDRLSGDLRGESSRLGNLGLAYRDLGNTQRAAEYTTKALEIARQIGENDRERIFLIRLADIFRDLDRYEESVELTQQALKFAEAAKDHRIQAELLANLGNDYSKLNRLDEAIQSYILAEEIYREHQEQELNAYVLSKLGTAYLTRKDWETSIQYFESALACYQQADLLPPQVEILNSLGKAYAGMGDNNRALEYYNRIMEIEADLKDQVSEEASLTGVIQGLDLIEGIGAVYGQKLRQAGIQTTQQLLERGATPRGRQELVEQTGISQRLILEWVNHADLFRVKGIKETYADLLEAAGIDNVNELAQRNPENLYQKLQEVNEAKSLVRRLPSLTQVEDWVAQARQLPRVISY